MNVKYYRAYINKVISLNPTTLDVKGIKVIENEFGETYTEEYKKDPEVGFLCLKNDRALSFIIHDHGHTFRSPTNLNPNIIARHDSNIEENDIINNEFKVVRVVNCMDIYTLCEVERMEV